MYPKKKIFLVRHGETEWTNSGQHTGITDIPLTKNGESQAEQLGKRLRGHSFAAVFCSPLKRSQSTCEIAGLFKTAKIDPDLIEWNYGKFEGLTSEEIRKASPHWNIFLNGAPGGESVADVGARANKVLAKINSIHGDVALFSHGHFLRALAARWLGLPAQDGRLLDLSPGSLSILGFEREERVLLLWNELSN
jgi:broad specificity phosphatase PhoE